MKEKIIKVLEEYLLDGLRRYNWNPIQGEKELEEIADKIIKLFKNKY